MSGTAGPTEPLMQPLRDSINVTLDGGCDHNAILPHEALHRHATATLDRADTLRFGWVAFASGAVAAGGSTYDQPEDYGFMYTHSFVDPDGHGWGLMYAKE